MFRYADKARWMIVILIKAHLGWVLWLIRILFQIRRTQIGHEVVQNMV